MSRLVRQIGFLRNAGFSATRSWWEHDCIRAAERGGGAREAARGQQSIFEITWRHEYDVEIASERAMLKPSSSSAFAYGTSSRQPALLGSGFRRTTTGTAKSSRDQQRHIAEIGHAPVGITPARREFSGGSPATDAKRMPRSFKSRRGRSTKGVCRDPPADRFPTLMTGCSSRRA